MQKAIATFMASLLLFPAASVAQDSKIDYARMIARLDSSAPPGTLRESAIRQAGLAAASDPSQGPQTPAPSNRPSLRSDAGNGALWGALIGTSLMTGAGIVVGVANDELDLILLGGVTGAAGGAIWGSIIGLVVHAKRQP